MRIGDLKLILEEMIFEEEQLNIEEICLMAEEKAALLQAKMLLIAINSGELSAETKNQIMKNGNEFIDMIFKINSKSNNAH